MSDKLSVVQLADIVEADDNLRTELTEIRQLADSIAFIGLLEPIRLTRNGTPGKFKVIAGHRRLAALKLNGETETKAIIQSGETSDSDRVAAMLVENMQRVDLSPLEQAEGVRRLVTDHGMTQNEVATNLGVSRDWVKDRVAMLNVPPTAFAEYSPGHALSVKHLALLGSLDEDRRKRLLDKAPVPNAYDIEDAWNKQMSKANADRMLAKLVKDGYLAITEKDLKRLIKAEVASLSGTDMVIKQVLGAATKIGDQWSHCPAGETMVILKQIHRIDSIELQRNTVYVVKNSSGYQSWHEVSLKKGSGVATSTDTADDEPDEIDMIDQRNHERRTVHAAAKLAAEIDFVAKAKPAELIAIVLSRRLDAMEASYGMPERTRAVCERLGLDVADIDPTTVDYEIRKENHAANVKAVRDYAAKNGSNLARAAMTAEIVIYPHVTFDAIAYPDEPEYEEYPDDEYEDGF